MGTKTDILLTFVQNRSICDSRLLLVTAYQNRSLNSIKLGTIWLKWETTFYPSQCFLKNASFWYSLERESGFFCFSFLISVSCCWNVEHPISKQKKSFNSFLFCQFFSYISTEIQVKVIIFAHSDNSVNKTPFFMQKLPISCVKNSHSVEGRKLSTTNNRRQSISEFLYTIFHCFSAYLPVKT